VPGDGVLATPLHRYAEQGRRLQTPVNQFAPLDGAQHLGEVLLHPGQVHLVEADEEGPVGLVPGAAAVLQEAPGPEAAVDVDVTQQVGAVGPVRPYGNDLGFGTQRTGELDGQLRLTGA